LPDNILPFVDSITGGMPAAARDGWWSRFLPPAGRFLAHQRTDGNLGAVIDVKCGAMFCADLRA
jgi:hypothetical protein